MIRSIRLAIAVLACLSLLGCMTMQPIAADRSQVSAGDNVEIVTKGGQHVRMKVERVDESGLHGEGQDIAFGDIQMIHREKVALGRTLLVVLGIAAVAAAAAGGGGGGGGY